MTSELGFEPRLDIKAYDLKHYIILALVSICACACYMLFSHDCWNK